MPASTTNLDQSASSVLPLVAALSAGVVCLVGLEEFIRVRRKHAAKDGKQGGRQGARQISAEERRKLRDPPRVPTSMETMWKNLMAGKEPHMHEEWRDKLGCDIFYLQLPLGQRIYICTDISCWDTLIGPDGLDKSDKYHAFDLFKENALTSTLSIITRKTAGENWHAIRKALSPAFSTKTLVSKTPIYHRVIGDFCKAIDGAAEQGESINMPEWATRFTLDMIGEVAFNYPLHAFDEKRNGEALAVLDAIEVIFYETRCTVLVPLRPYMFWLSHVRKYYKALRLFRHVCNKIYRNYLDTPPDKRDTTSVIAYIHKAPYPSEFEKICDIYNLLWAGHDTTGYTISWGIYHLSTNPQVLKKMQQELDGASFAGQLPTYEELSQLPYFNACIKEILRLTPVASNGSFRKTEGGIKVTSRGVDYWIPGGCEIGTPILAGMRDDRIWGDGKVFRPERWLEATEEELKLYNKTFLPFSIPPRSCIGSNLAMIEVRLTMAALFSRFVFEVTKPPEPYFSIT
ncbi:unnamed protein product [Vitrella brassicaformis CCMP3155]|uniref:Cytochrome P450 n=1 Tax=Vitrella brassicaformis (strain CCMP3155) TaxID=1169540 RepID=A0A0G4FUP2_VITBC|nr:unnamed protein product [Vitrella brassicaformis CCMP3155]|eukprot:CEM18669.1 unnamed protein product [Vitrella brassicaformis CCMP3155]